MPLSKEVFKVLYRDTNTENDHLPPEKRFAIEVITDPRAISFEHKDTDEISDATRIAARRTFLLDNHELFGLEFTQVLKDYIGYKNIRLHN